MIAQEFLRNPQKNIFLVAFFGLFVGDLIHAVILITNRVEISQCLFYLIFLSIQFAIYLVLFIVYLTCWKGMFFQKLLATYLQRFLVFFSIILIHFYIVTYGIEVIVHINTKEWSIVFSTFAIIQLLSIILTFIGLYVTSKNPSDRAILENHAESLSSDFFRNPQKTILIVSLALLIPSTLIQNIYLISWILVKKDVYSISPKSIFNILMRGVIESIIDLIIFITYSTCYKGYFVQTFLYYPVRRYFLLVLHAFIHTTSFIDEIKFFIQSKKFFDDKIFFVHSLNNLLLNIIQVGSLLSLFAGLFLACRNKSDKEILENKGRSEYTPLFEDLSQTK